MVRRVAMETRALVGDDAAAAVSRAVGAALAPRDAAIDHDHDSRILHPGRTVLILLSDTTCRDPDALAAAAFVESVDAEFIIPDDVVRGSAPAGSVALLEDLPRAPADRLLEELVVADERATLILLAERLDHARHLHLREDLDWRAFHDEVVDVWLPVAHRAAAGLARRLDRWEESFRRRLVGR